MPKKPVPLAFWQYKPGQVFTLYPDQRNHGLKLKTNGVLIVRVLRPLKVGFGMKVQTVLVQVEEGDPLILGSKIILRFYDTLYVSPDLLDVIPYCKYC